LVSCESGKKRRQSSGVARPVNGRITAPPMRRCQGWQLCGRLSVPPVPSHSGTSGLQSFCTPIDSRPPFADL
jgi:hypothetical protein